MVTVSEHLNSIDFAQQLAEVAILLERAETRITFWGARVVTLPGFEGSILLEHVTRKVQVAASRRSESDDLSLPNRLHGIRIIDLLRNAYHATDRQVRESNILTRILNFIREFSFVPYVPRFYIEQGLTECRFRGYSEEKFLETFGGTQEELQGFGRHPHSDGGYGPPCRVTAKRASIEELLNRV